MRDPRLIEIDFLMDLERSGQLSLRSKSRDEDSGVGTSRTLYGTDGDRFRDMVLGLILQGHLVGLLPRTYDRAFDEEGLKVDRRQLTSHFTQGEDVPVHLSHAGRVHLWNLRDAL